MGKRLTHCCCFSVRTGSLIMASLGIFFAAAGVIGYSFFEGFQEVLVENINNGETEMAELYHRGQITREEFYYYQNVMDIVKKAIPFVGAIGLTFALLSLIKHVMLLCGILYKKSCLMLPWLIIVMMGLVTNTLAFIGCSIFLFVQGGVGSGFISLAIFVPALALGFYFWTVVQSHFKEIRAETYDTLPIVTHEVPPNYDDVVIKN